MIEQRHMDLLAEELEQLRDGARRGRLDPQQIDGVRRLAARMLDDGREGPFEDHLEHIHQLLMLVGRCTRHQVVLDRFLKCLGG